MKIAMAQMSMSENMDENWEKVLTSCKAASDCDLIFFPEIQFSPFFPQYEKRNVEQYKMTLEHRYIKQLCDISLQHRLYISPNLYLEENGNCYDASLWIDANGRLVDVSKMVHVVQAPHFYEKDYYTPSEEGFKVFRTEFGNVGIVICFDRHLPESIRTCVLKGADLVLIPTANCKDEPMEMFEWEIRVQAMQNQVFIAMCNRVGQEGSMDFSGESIIAGPDGSVLLKADDTECLLTYDVDLAEAANARQNRKYIAARRPDMYW